MTLQSFPRGGKKPTKSETSDVSSSKKRDKDGTKWNIETDKDGTNLIASTAERLSNTIIQEGLTILGRIADVTEYDMIISLPGGLKARLQVTDIHESYTKLLESIIKSDTESPPDFKHLPELYNVGEYIVCYVKDLKADEKWRINLSLDPRLINQNINHTYLIKGAQILCTITSKEDHGYVVDTGIANVRAFVPFKKVDPEAQYFPGKQLVCCIKELNTSDNTSIIKLSAKQKHIGNICTDMLPIDALMPGTKFELSIKRILWNGLLVSFGEDNVGYINQMYLDNPLSSYEEDTEVIGTLLYIVPTVKSAYFTLLMDKDETQRINTGTIIENATVLYRESHSIVFKLKSTVHGIVPLRKTDVDYDEIRNKFKPGTKHRCRVLGYDGMEKVYVCTMEHELLNQKFFSLSDFTPGDVVDIKIVKVNRETNFVSVSVGRVNGTVAPLHISDDGVGAIKKLKPGANAKARVLYLDKSKNEVYFTLKQSLVESDLPVLHDVGKAKRGSRHHGTIVQITKNGLLVRFFGHAKGWIPCTHLKKSKVESNWGYTVGQTVTVSIESVDKTQQKIKLRIANETVPEPIENFYIGEPVEGTIIDSSSQGVHVKISKNNGQNTENAFLPAGHMAPCTEIAGLLASKCVPGDTISALVFATTPTVILTRTFVSQEKYRDFNSLNIGDCIPCSIRDISQDGVRVILPITDYATFGFVPYNEVSNTDLLHVNQIMFVKITSIDREERLLGLTMSFEKIWIDNSKEENRMSTAVDSLHLYFNKLSELANNPYYENRPISSVRLGQRVTGEVTKITHLGLVVKLENNVQGVVRKGHYKGNLKVGDSVSGAIIWINYVHEMVDVTLLPMLVNNISTQQSKLPVLPFETVLRGDIIMVTNWFIIINLKGQGKGSLAALPARRHINDIQPNLQPYALWSRIRCYAILNRNESDIMPICMLKSAFESSKGVFERIEKKQQEKQSTVSKKRKLPVQSKNSKAPKGDGISKQDDDGEQTEIVTKKFKKGHVGKRPTIRYYEHVDVS